MEPLQTTDQMCPWVHRCKISNKTFLITVQNYIAIKVLYDQSGIILEMETLFN